MKKNLLIVILALTGFTAQCQVTLLKANKGLENGFVQLNGKAFMTSKVDSSLWITDGTPEGTLELSSIIRVGDEGGLLNGNLIFTGRTDALGWELYISDGTIAGTHLLKDIYTGAPGSEPDDFAMLNSQLYFSAKNAANGRELWKTNGTDAGTSIVKDIVQGPESSNSAGDYNLFSNGTYLLFSALTPSSGKELYKSDGTAGGTNVLADINSGPDDSSPANFYSYNNIVLFSATTEANGQELWKTDGTASGTSLLKDIWQGPESSSSLDFFYPFNGKLLFNADNGINGEELWITDGTPGNTHMVKDINAGAIGSSASLFSIITIGSKVIFSASDSTRMIGTIGFPTNSELWESDGTEAGTKLFKEIVDSAVGSSPFIFAPFDFSTGTFQAPLFKGNKFFFIANTPEQGYELWISDGTSAGTHIVKDINPGDADGIVYPSYIFTKDAMYFSADNGVNGNEVWKSDGTETGTVMVADINPNVDPLNSNSNMELPFFLGDKIIFSANNGDDANSNLYRLDGTFAPLPLKLGNFTVAPAKADALLQWTTLSEENTKDFTIQRSDNGLNFTAIGSVAATGTSSSVQSYYFTDAGIMNCGKEIIYYRLVSADKDGKTYTSKTISLKLNAPQWTVRLMSNVVQSNLDIRLTGTNGNIKISIIDITGKTISSSSATASDGRISLPSSSLATGMYFLIAEKNNERRLIKFLKQ